MGTGEVSLKEHFDSRLAAIEKATSDAREAMEKRLDGMNEFRETLRDQAGRFISRPEHDAVCQQIQELKEFRGEVRGKASQTSVIVAYVIAVISIIIGVVGLIR